MKQFLATAVAVTALVISIPFLWVIWCLLVFAERFDGVVHVRKP